MSNDRSEIYGSIAERFTLAATTSVYAFTVSPGQNAMIFKLLSGGTFEIVSGSSFVAGNGYPLGANEVLTLDASGTIYGMASGATVVLATLKGRSAGF
jgi:hypothetical protein